MGLLFGIFWLWVIIAGFKSVGRRISGVLRLDRPSGAGQGIIWSNSGSQLLTGDSAPRIRSTSNQPLLGRSYGSVSNQPMRGGELVHAPADIWTPEERRSFGRKLDQAAPVSPDAVLSEMQRELDTLVRNAADVEKNLQKWRGDLGRIEAAQKDWQGRAELAVQKGRDPLARAALEQKAKLAPRAASLAADIGRMEELAVGYIRDITALEAKLSESTRRHVVIQSRLECAEDSVRARELIYGQRTAAALSSLEALDRAADLAEGQAEALTLGADPQLTNEFAALEKEAAIDRELAALKAAQERPAA